MTEMIFGANRAIHAASQRCTHASKMCILQKNKKHWHKEFITHCQSLVWSLCAAYLITSAFNQLSNWGVCSYLHWLSLLSPSSGAPCLHSRSRTQYNKCKVLYASVRVCACSGGKKWNTFLQALVMSLGQDNAAEEQLVDLLEQERPCSALTRVRVVFSRPLQMIISSLKKSLSKTKKKTKTSILKYSEIATNLPFIATSSGCKNILFRRRNTSHFSPH